MWKSVVLIVPALMLAGVASAQNRGPIGKETTIADAANGGIRNWQNDPKDRSAIYVQDRRLAWYHVQLTGPCLQDVGPETIVYETDPGGRLDRFSRVYSTRTPQMRCGVTSIKTSAPPASIRSDHAAD